MKKIPEGSIILPVPRCEHEVQFFGMVEVEGAVKRLEFRQLVKSLQLDVVCMQEKCKLKTSCEPKIGRLGSLAVTSENQPSFQSSLSHTTTSYLHKACTGESRLHPANPATFAHIRVDQQQGSGRKYSARLRRIC